MNKISTPREFVAEVINLYHKSREPIYSCERISRGRSRTISGAIEDLVALYLANNLSDEHSFFVDQPITIDNGKIIYPDIIISKNGTIVRLIDVKIDLGWNRNGFIDFCKQMNELIMGLHNRSCTLKDGKTKAQSKFKFSDDCLYYVVLISSRNISKEKYNANIKGVQNFPYVKVQTLTKGKHPNAYFKASTNILGKIEVDYDAFKRLVLID